MVSVQNRSKKCAAKSGTNRHTHTQTDRIGPIQSSSGAVFWTAKSQIPLADASKTCPQNGLRIPVSIPFKEHLRLASVVALSSSGACGAKKQRKILHLTAVAQFPRYYHIYYPMALPKPSNRLPRPTLALPRPSNPLPRFTLALLTVRSTLAVTQ